MFIQEMTVEECREALVKAGFGRLACAHENQPYIVPIYFAVDSDDVYLFSIPGQKIEWMRTNPQVCLEIDSVKGPNNWTSVVVLGRYEEFPDTPDFRIKRQRAHEFLQKRAMWWEPGSVALANHGDGRDLSPVLYRIKIERLTGRRSVPTPDETAPAHAIPQGEKGGWLSQVLHPSGSKN